MHFQMPGILPTTNDCFIKLHKFPNNGVLGLACVVMFGGCPRMHNCRLMLHICHHNVRTLHAAFAETTDWETVFCWWLSQAHQTNTKQTNHMQQKPNKTNTVCLEGGPKKLKASSAIYSQFFIKWIGVCTVGLPLLHLPFRASPAAVWPLFGSACPLRQRCN